MPYYQYGISLKKSAMMKYLNKHRFSSVAAGIISLPLEGLFIIEARYFSGLSIEYTLREI